MVPNGFLDNHVEGDDVVIDVNFLLIESISSVELISSVESVSSVVYHPALVDLVGSSLTRGGTA